MGNRGPLSAALVESYVRTLIATDQQEAAPIAALQSDLKDIPATRLEGVVAQDLATRIKDRFSPGGFPGEEVGNFAETIARAVGVWAK